MSRPITRKSKRYEIDAVTHRDAVIGHVAITTLLAESRETGDRDTVELCRAALSGDPEAYRRCIEVIHASRV